MRFAAKDVALGVSSSSRSYARYGLLAGGLLLIFLSFQTSNVAFLPLLGCGFALVLVSIKVGKRDAQEGKTG